MSNNITYSVKNRSFNYLGMDSLKVQSFHKPFFQKYGQLIAPFRELELKENENKNKSEEKSAKENSNSKIYANHSNQLSVEEKEERSQRICIQTGSLVQISYRPWQKKNMTYKQWKKKYAYKIERNSNFIQQEGIVKIVNGRKGGKPVYKINLYEHIPRLRGNDLFFEKRDPKLAQKQVNESFLIAEIGALLPKNEEQKNYLPRKIDAEDIKSYFMQKDSQLSNKDSQKSYSRKKPKKLNKPQFYKKHKNHLWIFQRELSMLENQLQPVSDSYQSKLKRRIKSVSNKIQIIKNLKKLAKKEEIVVSKEFKINDISIPTQKKIHKKVKKKNNISSEYKVNDFCIPFKHKTHHKHQQNKDK